MKVRLVRTGAKPNEPGDAWLLTERSSEQWLQRIARWEKNVQQQIRLFVLPDGHGAMATVPEGCTLPSGTRVIPYRRLGNLLYPADAAIDPPIDAKDVSEWIAEGIAVWHPVAGVCSFYDEDALTVANLITSPEVLSDQWTSAHPGSVSPPILKSVRLKETANSVSTFLQTGREDIASKPIKEVPRATFEPGPAAPENLKRAVQETIYKSLARLSIDDNQQQESDQHSRVVPSSENIFNRIGSWAAEKLARLESARQRELNRLLHLLQTDPDEGLRFAPPLSSRGNRGTSAIGDASLIERDPSFNLSTLGGGHVSSPWSLEVDTYERLRREYREVANRELSLKRYRRAAYIFSHLLEDHQSAAEALKQGRHFREAALLYRDFTNRSLEAAECFWEAGEFEQAEPLFVGAWSIPSPRRTLRKDRTGRRQPRSVQTRRRATATNAQLCRGQSCLSGQPQ